MTEEAKYFLEKDRFDFSDLVRIMALLRSEDGCPWDREQTHASIRKNLIEESYEAAEAIDAGDPSMLKEELGDVLLQVIFHAQIEKESGGPGIDDIIDAIVKKLVFRHPHIFGGEKVGSAAEMLDKWEAAKRAEKGQSSVIETLRAVPSSLPALMRAEKLYSRTEKGGYGFCDAEDALRKAEEHLGEGTAPSSFGKALFCLCAWAHKSGLDAEEELYAACREYTEKFEEIKQKYRNFE